MVRGSWQTRVMLDNRRCLVSWILVCLVSTAGCQKFPSQVQLQQYQMENEKLLGELRAQKRKAEELEQKNSQLAQRLDETERLVAQSGTASPSSRISSNGSSSRRTYTPGAGTRSSFAPDPQSLGSPPATFGHLKQDDASVSNAPKWKPISKRP